MVVKLKHNKYERHCDCIKCERERNAKAKEEKELMEEKLRPRYQREPGSFDLKAGMKDEQVINTLRGYVSGETAQEIQSFFQTTKMDKSATELYKTYAEIAHPEFRDFNIVAADVDRRYALIEKTSHMIGRTTMSQTKFYFLTGINDDDKYFVHPLFDVPQELLDHAYTGNIRPLTDWVDRIDEGFDRRIQGDILIQYRDSEPTISLYRQTTGRRNNNSSGMVISGNTNTFVAAGIWDNVTPTDFTTPMPSIARPADPHSNHILTLQVPSQSASISKIRTFGRHQLITDGSIDMVHDYLDGENTDYYIVQGTQLLIQHPEHHKTQEAIPKGKLAIITNQRGRNQERRFD